MSLKASNSRCTWTFWLLSMASSLMSVCGRQRRTRRRRSALPKPSLGVAAPARHLPGGRARQRAWCGAEAAGPWCRCFAAGGASPATSLRPCVRFLPRCPRHDVSTCSPHILPPRPAGRCAVCLGARPPPPTAAALTVLSACVRESSSCVRRRATSVSYSPIRWFNPSCPAKGGGGNTPPHTHARTRTAHTHRHARTGSGARRGAGGGGACGKSFVMRGRHGPSPKVRTCTRCISACHASVR